MVFFLAWNMMLFLFFGLHIHWTQYQIHSNTVQTKGSKFCGPIWVVLNVIQYQMQMDENEIRLPTELKVIEASTWRIDPH